MRKGFSTLTEINKYLSMLNICSKGDDLLEYFYNSNKEGFSEISSNPKLIQLVSLQKQCMDKRVEFNKILLETRGNLFSQLKKHNITILDKTFDSDSDLVRIFKLLAGEACRINYFGVFESISKKDFIKTVEIPELSPQIVRVYCSKKLKEIYSQSFKKSNLFNVYVASNQQNGYFNLGSSHREMLYPLIDLYLEKKGITINIDNLN